MLRVYTAVRADVAALFFEYAVRGSLFLYVGGPLAPGEHWDDYVEAVGAVAGTHRLVRMAVFTSGGSPTPVQRRSLMSKLSAVEHRAAVITGSAAARTVVTVFAWLGSTVRAFSPHAVSEAYEYLSASPAERAWLDANYAKFTAQISDKTA